MNIWEKVLISNFKSLPYGKLYLILPDKSKFKFDGFKKGPIADLHIKKMNSAKKILTEGSIGFAEEFINGSLTTKNLAKLMDYLAFNNHYIEKKINYSLVFKLFNFLRHLFNKNTKSGAKKNIKSHYDLGNDFYKVWLDSSMTYSSAIFKSETLDLFTAQKNKYNKIINLSEIKNGDNVLEIGCGWGGFIEHTLQKQNCFITATTISDQQYNFVREKIKKLNIESNINLIKKDYREINGLYDKIVSIEMLEGVGYKYWDVYFSKLRRLIKNDGIISLQTITIKDEVFNYYKSNPDFIQKYIFPGGMLPSIAILEKIIIKNSLKIISIDSYYLDYVKTLKMWRDNFENSLPRIKELGFDNKFLRLWSYYLTYCESGFKSKNIDLNQIKIVPI